MFESIKKWFKRPVIINFTVEPLSPDAAINVLKYEKEITPELAEHIRRAWPEFCEAKAVIIGAGMTLEQLSDEQLKDIGLMRIRDE
ncbi:DUF1127 domain-containing protein [Acinetobacter radioresistens]|uniref:hypothetical protein n=1 Tax=Acinetobacter radioresistens TaxID=40216 RepID=UPI00061917BA|nr:hypothetical protein [Acinetobacter radioresistens]